MPGIEHAHDGAAFCHPLVGFVENQGAVVLMDRSIEGGGADVDIGLRSVDQRGQYVEHRGFATAPHWRR